MKKHDHHSSHSGTGSWSGMTDPESSNNKNNIDWILNQVQDDAAKQRRNTRLLKLGFIGLLVIVVGLSIFTLAKPTTADPVAGTCVPITKGGTNCDVDAMLAYLGLSDIKDRVGALESNGRLVETGSSGAWQYEKWVYPDGSRRWVGRVYNYPLNIAFSRPAQSFYKSNYNTIWPPAAPSGVTITGHIARANSANIHDWWLGLQGVGYVEVAAPMTQTVTIDIEAWGTYN